MYPAATSRLTASRSRVARIADPPAARQGQPQPLPVLHELPPLRPELRPVRKFHPPRRALGPAIPAARGVLHPVEHRVEPEVVAPPRLDLDHLPEPPRVRPAPPEPCRSSFRQTVIGPTCSVASTLMVETPEGKAVADSPSAPGRAPVPPELNIRISAGGNRLSGSDARALIWMFQSEDAPSAGTTPGIA